VAVVVTADTGRLCR